MSYRRPRCDIHGTHCPANSHHHGDEYGYDDPGLYGDEYDQAAMDDADAMSGWSAA